MCIIIVPCYVLEHDDDDDDDDGNEAGMQKHHHFVRRSKHTCVNFVTSFPDLLICNLYSHEGS